MTPPDTSERPSFEAVAAAYYPALVKRLALIVRDPQEAQDLAQATLLSAHEKWESVNRSDLRPWLYTIGIRLAINELRRRRRRPWQALREGDRMAETVSDPDLWAALGRLRREERAALVLTVLEGYSQAEVATRLGVPEGTVASWLSRTKARLRVELQEEEGPNGRVRYPVA